MTKSRKTHASAHRQTKRKRATKALRSAAPAEDILKQEAAYAPRKAGPPQGHARGSPERTPKLDHPMEVAAQHWMQAMMLPWAGWTALGAMMMKWPMMQMRFGALQHSDAKMADGPRRERR